MQKIKHHIVKRFLIGIFFFTYYFNHVFAQMETFTGNSSNNSPSAAPVLTNLGQKTLQQLVADFILLASQYVVTVLVALTVLVFLWGLMKFMFKGQGSDSARSEGRKLMLWGIIGLFVMTSMWGLVAIFSNFVGHSSVVIPQFK
jgi:hypothetical protein